MKFSIRAGFVVHDTRLVKQGDKQVEQTSSYYEGEAVDFDEATAANHLHKLEPTDRAATAFCNARFAPVAAQPGPAGVDPTVLAALVAQAVTQALAAMKLSSGTAPAA
ncbi:MAG: hypothetical protein WCH44_17800 [Betaproteobacteria bacterium]